MKYYMYMIRTLQLILHLPIFIIQAPANVSAFCSILIPVANFDFQIDSLLEKVISFAKDEIEKFPFAYELIGYGNNAITNMGSIFVINMFQNILIFVFVMLHCFGLNDEFNSFSLALKLQIM